MELPRTGKLSKDELRTLAEMNAIGLAMISRWLIFFSVPIIAVGLFVSADILTAPPEMGLGLPFLAIWTSLWLPAVVGFGLPGLYHWRLARRSALRFGIQLDLLERLRPLMKDRAARMGAPRPKEPERERLLRRLRLLRSGPKRWRYIGSAANLGAAAVVFLAFDSLITPPMIDRGELVLIVIANGYFSFAFSFAVTYAHIFFPAEELRVSEEGFAAAVNAAREAVPLEP